MTGPEHLEARRQRFQIELVRLAVATLGLVEIGQVP